MRLNSLKHIKSLYFFQIKQIISRPTSFIISSFIFPFVFYLNTTAMDVKYIKYFCAYFLLLQCFYLTLASITIAEAKNIEAKVIKRLSVTPLTKTKYIISTLLSQLTISFISILSMIMVYFYRGGTDLKFIIKCFPIFIIAYILYYFMALIIAHIFRDMQTSKTVGLFIYMFFIFLLSTNNISIEIISKITGVYYIKKLFVSVIIGKTNLEYMIPILVLIIIYYFLCKKTFKWK